MNGPLCKMLQLLSKSLRQKVVTITHLYSMLGLAAGKSCNIWVSCNIKVLYFVGVLLYLIFILLKCVTGESLQGILDLSFSYSFSFYSSPLNFLHFFINFSSLYFILILLKLAHTFPNLLKPAQTFPNSPNVKKPA